MNRNNNIFLTGVTGFLGSFLAKELMDRGYYLFVLARPQGDQSARDRVFEAVKFAYGGDWNSEYVKGNLSVIEGDIRSPDLAIKNNVDRKLLEDKISYIFHSAALTDFRASLDDIMLVNVEGTKNVLELASRCQRNGRLKKFNYISTIYIAGKKKVNFDEEMLSVNQEFNNNYELTKYKAELLVKKYMVNGLNASIFRPSMIIGDSKDGKISTFNLFYQPLHFFKKGIFEKFPADLDCYQNFINIDSAVAAIASLINIQDNRIFHIISPDSMKMKVFFEYVKKYFKFNLPEFIPSLYFDFDELSPVQKSLASPFITYFNFEPRFVSTQTVEILKGCGFEYPKITYSIFEKSFSYCNKLGYITKN